MPRVADHSESEESLKDNKKAAPDESSADEDDKEGTPEYEIEEVLDAKRGVFPDGRMGYYVRWKGYGPEENSWVDELDAINAKELVEEFWRKNPQKKRTADRKSLDKRSPDKPRKSAAAENGEHKPKKRGRKSAAQTTAPDDDMEVDHEPRAKKPRKNQPTKPSGTETPEEVQKVVGNMSRFMHLADWEGLVSSVDTVERGPGPDDFLNVYFTLNTGEAVVERSEVCNQRFPQTLLRFYETNLRWRTVEEDQ